MDLAPFTVPLLSMESKLCLFSATTTSFLFFLLLLGPTTSQQDSLNLSLISFLNKLSGNGTDLARKLGWNTSSNPCSGGWTGVKCNSLANAVRIIALEGLGLAGSIDAGLLCRAPSLAVLSLHDNNLQDKLPPEISQCKHLTHLYLSGNRLSGSLPGSLGELNNLKRIDISRNNFSGEIPRGLASISGLVTFLAENNRLTGSIPAFYFENFQQFDVFNNLLSGPIPGDAARFGNASFLGNPGLCGSPLATPCPQVTAPGPQPAAGNSNSRPSWHTVIMYSGYIILIAVFAAFILYKLIKKKQKKKAKPKTEEEEAKSGYKTSRSEFSITSSGESTGPLSSSLVVLKSPLCRDMQFNDLLKAPAELVGKGRHGSLYKVVLGNGAEVVVKRIKEWGIAGEEFRRRMERMDRVRHGSVLSAAGFYCSKQEKLVVYAFQRNGSLFSLLQSGHSGRTFGWSSRLCAASDIAEGMAFMHRELGIPHGNLKSSNILMTSDLAPLISEYGLLATDDRAHASPTPENKVNKSPAAALRTDVYGLGMILLELLTGKPAQNRGMELARWVGSVVSEEWTAEVFDKVMVAEGASEAHMVQLLQVALGCVSAAPEARPTMSQTAAMIGAIRDEEDNSGFCEL